MYEKANVVFNPGSGNISTESWNILAKPAEYTFREIPNGWCISNGVDYHYATNSIDIYKDMYDNGLYEELKLTTVIIIQAPNSPELSWITPILPQGLTPQSVSSRLSRMTEVLERFNVKTKVSNMYHVLVQSGA